MNGNLSGVCARSKCWSLEMSRIVGYKSDSSGEVTPPNRGKLETIKRRLFKETPDTHPCGLMRALTAMVHLELDSQASKKLWGSPVLFTF